MMDDAAIARLQGYTIDSNEALEFKLIRDEQDIEDPDVAFGAEMSHQVFGDRYDQCLFYSRLIVYYLY